MADRSNLRAPRARTRAPWLSHALHVFGCFWGNALATFIAGFEVQHNLIWVANGVLLSYLLVVPRWSWPRYLAAGILGQLAGTVIVGGLHLKPSMLIGLGLLNGAEAAIAALFLRRRSAVLPRFANGDYLLRFFGFAVLLGPAVAAIGYAAGRGLWHHSPYSQAFIDWVATDGLGMLVSAPACVAILRMRMREFRGARWNLLLVVGVTALGMFAFARTDSTILPVVYPVLILILLRLGMGWASISVLLVATVGNWILGRNYAVAAHVPAQTLILSDPSMRLEVFVISAVFMLYSVSVVMESRRRAEHRLAEIASLHELVTSNSRDIILLTDLKGVPTYISPAVLSLTGRNAEEAMQHGFSELVHPDDLARVDHLMARIRDGLETAMIEYRLCCGGGACTWVEARFHAVRDPRLGLRSGILQIIRDIGERKAAEEQLQVAYRALEDIAAVDALTGLANRRSFDEALDREWRRGMRDHKPLSIVLLDVDLFKLYNDTYGHVRGDSCLKQVANSATEAVTRAADLVARFGGEEFAIILPNTDEEGALGVAAEVAEALRGRALPHESSPYGVVTISAGCATQIPDAGSSAVKLLERSDRALYRAKHTGRNRICGAGALESEWPTVMNGE